MSEPLVLRNDENGVTTLTLNRPNKLNALNPALFVEFRTHLDAIAGVGSPLSAMQLVFAQGPRHGTVSLASLL